MYCKFCGKIIDDDAIFCCHCGRKISDNSISNKEDKLFGQVNPHTSSSSNQLLDERNAKIAEPQTVDELLKSDLETQAATPYKSIPMTQALAIILLGLGLGLYYWFGNDFIFSYDSIKPFFGFLLILVITLFVLLIVAYIYSSFVWNEYNGIIEKAQKEIERKVANGEGTPEEIERMRISLLERKLSSFRGEISDEDFKWHTSKVCWGCGKKHECEPVPYLYVKKRTESWKSGPYRKYKEFHQEAYINICPECAKRLKPAWTPYISSIGETKFDFDKIPDIVRFKNKDLPHF